MEKRAKFAAAISLVAFSCGVVFCSLLTTSYCSAVFDDVYHKSDIDRTLGLMRQLEDNLNQRIIQLEERSK